MADFNSSGMTRRGLLGAFAATAVAAAPTYSNAAGFLRGGGDVRRLTMFSGRTGERLDTIYWIDGQYIGEAIREVNAFMRDWRTGEIINMDTRTIDIMAAAHNLMDAKRTVYAAVRLSVTTRPTPCCAAVPAVLPRNPCICRAKLPICG